MAEPGEPLTERELEVVRLLGTGAANKEIAAQLYLSPNTVKVHLRNIFTKLEAKTRTEVTMIAVRNGWLARGNIESTPTPIAPSGVVEAPPAEPGTPPEGKVENRAAGAPFGSLVVAAPVNANDAAVTPGANADQPALEPQRPAVPVAPNPQPLPRLPVWRRLAVAAALIIAIALGLVGTPTPRTTAAPGQDGTEIVESASAGGDLLPGEATRWYLRAPLPAPRARSMAVTVKDKVYLIGGETKQVASGDVLLYDPKTNTWTPLEAPKPTPVWNAAVAVIGDRIYVPGGATANGVATDRLEALDTASSQWVALKPMPEPMSGHSAAALNGKLYVFGDKTNNAASVDSFEYDPAADAWKPIAPMPTPRSLSAAAALNDRIYVVGGYDEGRELATCEYYVPVAGTWGACSPMLLPRGSPGLVRVGANLFAVGGGWNGFVGFSERYDSNNDRWTPFETPLVGDWRSTAVAALPTEFYVFGGYSNGRRLAFSYVYEVFTQRTFVPAFQQSGNQP